MFGKYQLCRVLGTGRAGTVFLAVHLGLEEYRAVKRVSKSFLDYERFRREALILKELRHPGIPIIYDIEEDESYSYLIEEYLEGESLFDLVKNQGHLSRELAIHYGIQLTQIVSYLHLAGPNPILHLDLQPKNLLLCHDTIKLIDFDHAASPEEASASEMRYGTVGCAAPEQYLRDGLLDERTDIYAVGASIYYLLYGRFPHQPYKPDRSEDAPLARVLKQCLESDREKRYSSAKELEEGLKQLENTRTVSGRFQSPSLIIALAGSKSGAGTTHIAIGLSVYLRNHGYPNLYEERNPSGMGNALGGSVSAKRDQYGLFCYRGFVWKPLYGQGVGLKEPPFSFRIRDYGADVDRALEERPDAVILVCDSRCWSREQVLKKAAFVAKSGLPCRLVYNHGALASLKELPEGIIREQCFRAPWYPDPFHPDSKTEEFFKALLAGLLKGEPQKGLKALLTRLVPYRIRH